ncbi:hypothetical protein PITCH_A240010 [uncultured Desulfobacterium sp.]|uniref:Uncharacterized protein n=1 Tax=uncultured Desulfobacterium sp. TaxID=201089 RepID=A0A445MYP1_9BACT|nr:hypothetical protein PITCH_A240010 [uncultured Desulfobacterium sp.]
MRVMGLEPFECAVSWIEFEAIQAGGNDVN